MHLQLQALFLLPLALLFVVIWARGAATPASRMARPRLAGGDGVLLLAAAAALTVQFYTAFYPGWFFVLWCLLFLGVALLVAETRTVVVRLVRAHGRALLAAAAFFAVLMIPFWILYSRALADVGGWPWPAVRALAPEWRSLLLASERSYVWGGLAAAMSRAHPPPSDVEHRMAVGLVASVAWIAVSLYAVYVLLSRKRRPADAAHGTTADAAADRTDAAADPAAVPPRVLLAVLVVSADLVLLLGLPWPGGFSPWQVVHRIVPGAQAIQVVTRSVLVLALPMAIAFAFLLHRALVRAERLAKPARLGAVGALTLLVAFGFLEQLGGHATFLMDPERSRLRRLSARLPEGCSAFYAVPGRRPGGVKYEDQLDAMLVAVVEGVPTLNGYSGHVPPGWRLKETGAGDYEERVSQWIAAHGVTGRVCRLEIGA